MPERTICLRDWESRTLRDLPAGGTLLLLRPVKFPDFLTGGSEYEFEQCAEAPAWWRIAVPAEPGNGWVGGHVGSRRCPFGAPGDVLLGKEAWTCYPTPGCTFGEAMMGKKITLEYRAGGTQEFSGGHATGAGMHIDWSALDFDYPPEKYGAWQPAQRLPRALVRHRPRVESVAVLPVQGLGKDDHEALLRAGYPFGEDVVVAHPERLFRRVWERDYGRRYPWESNPWAWALTVRREE
jgi:hypothetical protein